MSGFDDVRRLVPHSNTLHRAEAGPDGATVLDLFAPPRSEWAAAEAGEPGPVRWPG